jgi:alkylhydroperoxidase family enzyme
VSRIQTIRPERAQGPLADAYAAMRLSQGGVAHVIEVQSLNPQAMLDHHRLYRTLMFGPSPLSRVERELIAVVVSVANECFY